MTATTDRMTTAPKRVLMVVANPSMSTTRAFAVRDGRLITGQQHYGGRKLAELVIEALGV